MSSTSIQPCHHCAVALARGRSRCLYCGTAVQVGRQPSEREQYETSRAAVEDRHEQIVEARRTKGEYDRILLEALRAHFQPTAEFTHDYLAQLSGLNTSACKFALRRLQVQGVVRITGEVKVRSNRAVPRWQYLLPCQPIPTAAAPHRTVADCGRTTRARGPCRRRAAPASVGVDAERVAP